MKKRISRYLLFAVLPGIFFIACGDAPPDAGMEGTSLAWAVYAGEDPGGNWATFAFVSGEEGEKVYFFPDNALCYSGTYTYSSALPGGAPAGGAITEIIPAARNPPPAGDPPGSFTLGNNGKTITFTNYRGQGGSVSFTRVRDKNAADEAVPFTPGELPENLDGTVWAATAFRSKDWTTLTITAAGASSGTIRVSHSFDCTSFPRAYTDYAYNRETGLDYIGPFIIRDDVFAFQDFYGHGGKILLKRMR